MKDVQQMGLDSVNWHEEAQNRPRWYEVCQTILSGEIPRGSSVVTGSIVCGCGRTFGRSSDMTRHKKHCNDQPPPPKQPEFHCGCGRFFRRKGNLTRHQCYCSS